MYTKWKYYQHALIPDSPSFVEMETDKRYDFFRVYNEYKKDGGKHFPFFIRYSSGWDYSFETPWWYTIKDTPFNLSDLKSKYRYEITKGLKYFKIKKINPAKYIDDIYSVLIQAFSEYPEVYRPRVDYRLLTSELSNIHNDNIYYAAFLNPENNESYSEKICGFLSVKKLNGFIHLIQQKVIPSFEKQNINAALLATLLTEYNDDIVNKNYIFSNGERNIRHQTKFNNYLEKYFQFRKAYVFLNIKFHPITQFLILIIFPFRFLIRCFHCPLFYNIDVTLEFYRISRKCRKIKLSKEKEVIS